MSEKFVEDFALSFSSVFGVIFGVVLLYLGLRKDNIQYYFLSFVLIIIATFSIGYLLHKR